MLTVFDGGGESIEQERTIQVNNDGLVDISTTENILLTDQDDFQAAIESLNHNGKVLLYKRLQKEVSNCIKESSMLLAEKNDLYKNGDNKGAELVCMKCNEIRQRQCIIWNQIKQLYEILKAG